jgi:hypothetical protein
MDETTLNITCDVIEPSDGKGYERDPRSLAKRAEAYLKSTGLGDTAYFGPEPEFFVFDAVEWSVDMSGSYCKIFSSEAAWSSAEKFVGGNMGHRPTIKGGYFPVPPVDSLQDIRSVMCPATEQMGVEVEVHHHEVANAGQCEIASVRDARQARGLAADPEIRRAQHRARVWQDGDVQRRSPSSATTVPACTATSPCEGRQEHLCRRRLLGPVGLQLTASEA